MPGPIDGKDPLKKVKDAARRLPKGLGIRRGDIRSWMGPELCARWGIAPDEAIEVVRAKIVIRLEDVMVTMSDPLMAAAVKTSFNFSLDHPTGNLLLGKRSEALQAQGCPGLSMRNISRLLEKFLLEVDRSLAYALGAIPEARIQHVIAREHRSHRPPGSLDLEEKARGLWKPKDPVQKAVDAFLAAEVHTPRTKSNRLAIASTPDSGDWLCVFTDRRRLDAYRQEVRPPWSIESEVKRGAELVLDLTRQGNRAAGIVVNPSPKLGEIAPDNLLLPLELLRQLAAKM
jgi:hypothetical protein